MSEGDEVALPGLVDFLSYLNEIEQHSLPLRKQDTIQCFHGTKTLPRYINKENFISSIKLINKILFLGAQYREF
jgi:hypothetical protein